MVEYDESGIPHYSPEEVREQVKHALEIQLLNDRLKSLHHLHVINQNFNIFCPRCRKLLRKRTLRIEPERVRNFRSVEEGGNRKPSTPGDLIVRYI